MEMISVSKLRIQEAGLYNARKFFEKSRSLLTHLLSERKDIVHPLLIPNKGGKGILLCLFASDTGLCGPYNHNIIEAAENFLNTRRQQDVDIMAVGKKGFDHFNRRSFSIPKLFTELHGRYFKGVADSILKYAVDSFLDSRYSQVYVAYTRFDSLSRHVPVLEKFLDIEIKREEAREYIIEQDFNRLLEGLLPVYLSSRLKFLLLNSFASEHASRLIAMGEATDNASELLDDLVLLRNKVRQANITKEIIEIVSSAEALRG
jgi:F-type H+-transporting ATPase subunit gamma